MFNRDGGFWPQLAAYLYAVIVALFVLYGIGHLLTGDNLELSLNLGSAGIAYRFWDGSHAAQANE